MQINNVILGLGSNLGDRLSNLKTAIDYLSKFITDIEKSKIYQSPALLQKNSPNDWDISFLNMAISGNTQLSAHALLKEIKEIEKELGRESRDKWAPREIDIDILIFGDKNFSDENLDIPHKELAKRDFVLLPLNDLKPNWQHPELNQTAGEMLENINILAKLYRNQK